MEGKAKRRSFASGIIFASDDAGAQGAFALWPVKAARSPPAQGLNYWATA
jgi:hypothetical protein